MTSPVDEWLASRPGRFTSGKYSPYTLDRSLGEHRIGLDVVESIEILLLPVLELRPLAVHPVASRHTDCVIPAPCYTARFNLNGPNT
jgi:hypothetical protein